MTFMKKLLDMLNIENSQQHPNATQNVLNAAPGIDDSIITEVMCNDAISKTAATSVDEKREKPAKSSSIDTSIMPHKNTDDYLDCDSREANTIDTQEPIADIEHNTLEYAENSTIQYEKVDIDEDTSEEEGDNTPYMSNRLIINGVHLYFTDIAREIVAQKRINTIPLMREYHLSEADLQQVIKELQDAGILDSEQKATMSIQELERFLDIYEPSLFECKHTVFDRELFLCIGEIIFDKGVEDTYNCLPAEEVIDYLNIMERLKIIEYNDDDNEYKLLVNKAAYNRICKCIPSSFSRSDYVETGIDYKNVNFDQLSGIEFEKYCAHILLQNKFEDIKITPPSGDHGIDVLAEKDGVSYAIQCKCYSDNVGNAAVQQAHTGKSLYHKDIAVVMTNRYFTPQAAEEAAALGVKLWDRDKLSEMIGN